MDCINFGRRSVERQWRQCCMQRHKLRTQARFAAVRIDEVDSKCVGVCVCVGQPQPTESSEPTWGRVVCAADETRKD